MTYVPKCYRFSVVTNLNNRKNYLLDRIQQVTCSFLVHLTYYIQSSLHFLYTCHLIMLKMWSCRYLKLPFQVYPSQSGNHRSKLVMHHFHLWTCAPGYQRLIHLKACLLTMVIIMDGLLIMNEFCFNLHITYNFGYNISPSSVPRGSVIARLYCSLL